MTGQSRHPDTLMPLGYVWMPGPSALLTVAEIEVGFVAVARALLVSAWPLRDLEVNFMRRLMPGGLDWFTSGLGKAAHALLATDSAAAVALPVAADLSLRKVASGHLCCASTDPDPRKEGGRFRQVLPARAGRRK